MENYQGAFLIVAVCGIVLFLLAVKSNSHMILNLILRSTIGSILIFVINIALESVGIYTTIGLNVGTVLTTGILGFPGVLLLYGIKIYTLL